MSLARHIAPALAAAALLACAPAAHAADFPVTKTADTADGTCNADCSLREAIGAANAAGGRDRVIVPAGLYNLTINALDEDANAGGDLDVGGSLQLVGAGGGSTDIVATVDDRVLDALAGVTSLEVRGVSLQRGHDNIGGAIDWAHAGGSLAIRDVLLARNRAGGGGAAGVGGAVSFNGANLTVERSRFEANRAGGGTDTGIGGALATSANGQTISITGSSFVENVTGGASDTGIGGAVNRSGDDSTVTVVDTAFAGNLAGGSNSTGVGGAFNGSGTGGTHTFTRTSFTGNSAGGGPAGTGVGGALQTGNGAAVIEIADSHFAANTTAGDGGGTGVGGAVAAQTNSAGGSISILRTNFERNRAGGVDGVGVGGAASLNPNNGGLSVVDSSFSSNRAGTTGIGVNLNAQVQNGPTTILRSSFRDGRGGVGGTGFGGGAAVSATNSAVRVEASLFEGNRVGGAGGTGVGGGLYLSADGGTTTLVNDTATGNAAGGGSGGPGGAGGMNVSGNSPASITNVTVTNNHAGGDGGGASAGGLAGGGAARNISNSIISGNSAPTDTNCNAGMTSQGNNIEQGTSCGFTAPGDQNADPLVAPVADNGGPTLTQALLPGSPAVDAGANCAATDQRGITRPVGSACDIGAYEAGPSASTGGASEVTPLSARVAGAATPNFKATSVRFEYGTTTAYGSSTPGQDIGAGTGSVPVSTALTGLQPGTTYHYRVVAANADRTVAGADATFTTTPDPFAGLTIAKQSAALKGTKSFPLKVSCPATTFGTCTGTVTVTASVKRPTKKKPKRKVTITLGTVKFAIPAGGSSTLTVKLTKTGRTEMAKGRSLKATATAVAANAVGTQKTTKGAVTVKPAPKKKK